MSLATTISDSVSQPQQKQKQPVLEKIRTASIHGSPTLAHPTPDLQSLQGAYVQNVERLEERAERMSVGSDLGEEIRKLQQEQKESDSRRASLYSSSNAVELQQRPRNVSTSSYANSIVEVNTAARYGGYSPYSPIGSLRSGSWSQVSHPVSGPARSTSRSSRFGIMSTPGIEEATSAAEKKEANSAEDSVQHTPRPQSKSGSSIMASPVDEDTRMRRMKRLSTGRLPSDGSFSELYNQLAEANKSTMNISGIRVASDTSFTDIYDQIAGEIKTQLDTSVHGAQERETKRASLAAPAQLQPPFEASSNIITSPQRLSETPPPLPPQHKSEPAAIQEDYGINFSFTNSLHQPDFTDARRASGPLQIHVPHDDDRVGVDDRPLTANSQDTFQQAQEQFRDFDGTHYAPSIMSRYGSLREASGAAAAAAFPVEDPRHSGMLKDIPAPAAMAAGVPPPADGMVYYPAPVPRMLNLPQRISQAPSAALQAKRRTQILSAMPEDARKSAHWLPVEAPGGPSAPVDPRASRANLAALPPQLRASVFFDSGAARQDVEIRDQSAMRTLDDLLDASAMAPVGAFTDHPIVGKAGANVYKKTEEKRASNLQSLVAPVKKKERKSSFLGLRRSSVGSEDALNARHSAAPGRLDDSGLARGPHGDIGDDHSDRSSPRLAEEGRWGDLRDEDDIDHVDDGAAIEDEGESDDEFAGAPTTLLAELEMRKREQKQRTKTAFTAYPDGMHATLLELDDVARLEQVKRKKKRVALAWEDPGLKARDEEAERDDEEVPLGVLYQGNKEVQKKIKEMEMAQGRPLGLLERKELEDNEPLSRRRMRLLGVNPNMVRPPPVAITNPEGESESESEHEGETLGERMKRLRNKKVLDDAIDEVETRPVSRAFSEAMLSQLGIEAKDEKKSNESGPHTRSNSQNALHSRSNSQQGLHSRNMSQNGLHSRNISQGQISTGSTPKSPGGGVLPPSRSHATTPGTPGGDSEEETLGQRRARLQREAMTGMRRQSQLSLNPNARLSQMMLAGVDPNAVPTPARTPPLQASVSMADMLAAYPTGKNDARKFSNDMLLAAAPQGSLLAKNAESDAARKARMRLSSAEMFNVAQRPPMDRQQTNMTSNSGGMYLNQQQMYGMWQQQQQQVPQMYGQQQQYPMVANHPYGALNSSAGMSQHNLYGMQQQQQRQQYGAQPAMYHQQSYMSAPMQQEAYLDPKTRNRVDAWRQSIMP